jgi:hypothetical protein
MLSSILAKPRHGIMIHIGLFSSPSIVNFCSDGFCIVNLFEDMKGGSILGWMDDPTRKPIVVYTAQIILSNKTRQRIQY